MSNINELLTTFEKLANRNDRYKITTKDITDLMELFNLNQLPFKLTTKQKIHLNYEVMNSIELPQFDITIHKTIKPKPIKKPEHKLALLNSFLNPDRAVTKNLYINDTNLVGTNGFTLLSISGLDTNDIQTNGNTKFFNDVIKEINLCEPDYGHECIGISCSELLSKLNAINNLKSIFKWNYFAVSLSFDVCNYYFNLDYLTKVIKAVSELSYGLGIDNLDIELCISENVPKGFLKIYPACNSHNVYGIVMPIVESNSLVKPILKYQASYN